MGTAELSIDAQSMVMTIPEDFTELYERYYAMIFYTALRITGNPADAEDVMQTVFLRLLNQGGRREPMQVPEAYFRRSATNAALDLLRRRNAHREASLEDAAPQAAAESPALLKERLRRAIAKLEESDAEVFLLRYVEGLSNGELAEIFGQEKNHVAVRLHRIRQMLQLEMSR
jgi:RNA polymerase sigma factor (sigma-70 family)